MGKNKKSVFLIGLCILSMMGGFLGVLLGVLSVIDIDLISFAARIPGYTSIKSLTSDAHILYPYVKVVLYGISFWGAFSMLRLHRAGFFMYSIAQVLLLITPYLLWNLTPVVVFFTDLPDMIFTIAFIGAYSLFLPLMNQASSPIETGTEK